MAEIYTDFDETGFAGEMPELPQDAFTSQIKAYQTEAALSNLETEVADVGSGQQHRFLLGRIKETWTEGNKTKLLVAGIGVIALSGAGVLLLRRRIRNKA